MAVRNRNKRSSRPTLSWREQTDFLDEIPDENIFERYHNRDYDERNFWHPHDYEENENIPASNRYRGFIDFEERAWNLPEENFRRRIYSQEDEDHDPGFDQDREEWESHGARRFSEQNISRHREFENEARIEEQQREQDDRNRHPRGHHGYRRHGSLRSTSEIDELFRRDHIEPRMVNYYRNPADRSHEPRHFYSRRRDESFRRRRPNIRDQRFR